MREENNFRKRLGARLDFGEELHFLHGRFPDDYADEVEGFSSQDLGDSEQNATPDYFADLSACGDAQAEPWAVGTRAINPIPSEIASELDVSWSLQFVPRHYEVKLHFVNQAAATVGRVNWHSSQQTQTMDDGSLLVMFRIPNPEAMVHWLLKYGNNVTVLSPKWLKHKVRMASESA